MLEIALEIHVALREKAGVPSGSKKQTGE